MDRYITRQVEGVWEIFDTEKNEPSSHEPESLTAEGAQVIACFYNDGKCPMCPAEPMKPRRSRCPMCKEWISWVPNHPGHKLPFMIKGKVVWRKPVFKQSNLAFLRHTNSHRETHTSQKFIDTFYEKA